MKRKTVLALIAVLMLAMCLLTACGTEGSKETGGTEELEILRSFADYSRLEVYYGLGGEEIIADHIETEVRSWAELTESLSWERKPDNEVAALDPDAAIRIYRKDGASLYLAYSLDYVSVSGGPYEDTMVFYAGEDVFCLLYPWAVSQEDAEIHRFGA